MGIVSDAVDLSGLYATPFRRDRLVLLASRRHPLARRARVRYSETLDHDHVGLPASTALGVYLDDQAARIGRSLRARVRVQGFDAVARLVVQGAGLGIMPEAAARRWSGRGGARLLILDETWADRQLMLCARTLEALPNYARALIQALQPASRRPDMTAPYAAPHRHHLLHAMPVAAARGLDGAGTAVHLRHRPGRSGAASGTGGIFQVHCGGALLWDRKAQGGFPDAKTLKQLVRDHIDPGRDLGHARSQAFHLNRPGSSAAAHARIVARCPSPGPFAGCPRPDPSARCPG